MFIKPSTRVSTSTALARSPTLAPGAPTLHVSSNLLVLGAANAPRSLPMVPPETKAAPGLLSPSASSEFGRDDGLELTPLLDQQLSDGARC